MRVILPMVLVVMAVGQASTRAQDDTVSGLTPDRLRRELPAALRKIEQAYTNVRGIIIRSDETNFDALPAAAKVRQQQRPVDEQLHGMQLLERAEVRFAATTRYHKCEVVTLERGRAAQQNQDAVSKQLDQRVDCVGPRGAFALGWRTRNAAPELLDFSLEGGSASSRYGNLVQSWLKAAYTLPFRSLADLLGDKTFQIVRVDRVVVDGRDCLHVEFRYEFVPSAPAPRTRQIPPSTLLVGSFVVDPALGWALRSYEYATPGTDQSQSAAINYKGNEAGVALPVEVVMVGRKARRNQATFQEIAFGPTPEAEFTLAHYGMPELDRPIGDIGSSSAPRWIAGVSVVLLGAAAFFWSRSRPPRKDAPLGA